MSITIDADPASASANSYCTLDEADTYHAGSLHNSDWINANEETRKQALVVATRMLDNYVKWHGNVAGNDQPLAWPRSEVQRYDREIGLYYDNA